LGQKRVQGLKAKASNPFSRKAAKFRKENMAKHRRTLRVPLCFAGCLEGRSGGAEGLLPKSSALIQATKADPSLSSWQRSEGSIWI
jgi:hypothetical protein